MPYRPLYVKTPGEGPRLHGRCPHCKERVAVEFTPTVLCSLCGRAFKVLEILCVAPPKA
jgi:hypothetical protein